MLDKTKNYLIIGLLFLITIFGIFVAVNNYQKNKLNKEYIVLVKENKNLTDEIDKQKVINKKLSEMIINQTAVISIAQKNSDVAIAKLEKLQKIINIKPTADPVGVKEFISSTYRDDTVIYDKSKFLILDTTMYPLVTDAKEWIINGPILKTNLLETNNALNLLKITDSTKTTQIVNYEKRVDGLLKTDLLKDQLLIGKDGQITILEKQLKVEHNGAILTSVKVGVTCALIGWGYEHFRRK